MRTTGRRLFREWLTRHGVSQRRAAEALDVSEAAIHKWLTDDSVPRPLQRAKIATWTSGEVPEASWEQPSERKALAAVKPFVPHAAESGDTLDKRRERTGTDE